MAAHESPCERAWRTRATTTSSSTAPRLVAAARAAIAEPSSGAAPCFKRSTSSSALVRSIRRRTSRSTSAPEASSDSVTMSRYLYTTPDVKKHLRCWLVYRQEAERASRSASALLAEVWLPGPSSARSGPPEQVVRGSTRRTTRQNARRPDSAPLQYLRQPLERQLVPLARAPAVAARVLGGLVGDACLAQTVAQQPVAPLQVVVVVATHVQQDAGQFAETVQTVTPIDDWIEAQPAVPDLLDQLAARKGDGQVDVERRVVQVGRVTRRVRVDDLGQIVAFDRAGWRLRPDAVQVVIEKCLVRHVQKRVARKHRHGPERARIAGGEVPCPATSRREAEDATARRVL